MIRRHILVLESEMKEILPSQKKTFITEEIPGTVCLILTLTILFYSVLQISYSILFCFFLFFILFYLAGQFSIMFYFALYSIISCILFYSILLTILFYSILFFYYVNSIFRNSKICEYFLTSLISTFYRLTCALYKMNKISYYLT